MNDCYHHAAADHCSRITECPCAMVSPLRIDYNIYLAAACMIQELLSGVWLSTRVSAKPVGFSPLQNCQHKHNSFSTNQVCSLFMLRSFLYLILYILLLSCSEYVVYSTTFHERPLSCQIRCHGSGLQSLPTVNGDPRIYYLFSPGYGQQK